MANATSRVARDFRDYKAENYTHSYATVSSATQLYTGAMIGLNSSGYLTKFDDSASLKFMGVILDVENLGGGQGPKIPKGGAASGTQGDGTLDVDFKQVKSFVLNIASVAITDIGRRVYATFDNAGTLDPSATTYANFIGVVKDLVYATDASSAVANYALVAPVYDRPNGGVVQVASASGAVTIKESTVYITKAGVAALTIADPTTGVADGTTMVFISTTTNAHTLTFTTGPNGTSTHLATFGGAKGDGLTITAYAANWYIVTKTNVNLS